MESAGLFESSNTGVGDYFGYSVAVSGDTAVIGAAFDSSRATGVNGDQRENSAFGSGASYVFLLGTTGRTGDVNGDGVVNCADMAVIRAAFGKRAGQPGWDARADVVTDGIIDIRDLAFVSQKLPVGTQCQEAFGGTMNTALRTFGVSLLSLAASAAAISIEPRSSLTSTCGVVSVNVTIADVTALYAYQFDLAFDPSSVLSATAITEGGFLGSGGGGTFFIPGTIDNTLGTIAFTANTLLGAVPGVGGSGPRSGIQFNALAVGSSPITILNVTLLDSTGADVSAAIQNGAVRVSIPEPNSAVLLGSAMALALSAVFET